jgi:hypothetical protein
LLPAQDRKLASDLADLDPNEPVDVITQLSDSPSSRAGARLARSPALIEVASISLPTALFVNSVSSMGSVVADPRMKWISPDRKVVPYLPFADTSTGANGAFASGVTGAGIGIAIVASKNSN